MKLQGILRIIKNSFHFVREYSQNKLRYAFADETRFRIIIAFPATRRGLNFHQKIPITPWCHLRNHEIYDIQRTLPCRVTNPQDLHPLLASSTNFPLFIKKITIFYEKRSQEETYYYTHVCLYIYIRYTLRNHLKISTPKLR